MNNLSLVYLSIGSNINPDKNIIRSIERISESLSIKAVSTVWETPPFGTSGPNFYNIACSIHWSGDYSELRDNYLRPIENQLGRIRLPDKFAPRTIDIDIVIFHGEIIEPDIFTKAFYAVPLSEIIPDLTLPGTSTTMKEIGQKFLDQKHLIPHFDISLSIKSLEF